MKYEKQSPEKDFTLPSRSEDILEKGKLYDIIMRKFHS